MDIDRRQLFIKAHRNASIKKFNGCPRSYRDIFAECLKMAYADARRVADWRAMAPQREAQRDAQNIGFPIRSFRGERAFFGGSRFVCSVGA